MQPHSRSSVRACSDTLVLPTYLVDPPESSPVFYDGRQTQHTQADDCPYPAHGAEAQWLASAGARNPVAWSDRNYYRALSLRELRREEEALAHLREILG